MIIAEDADMKKTVDAILFGKCINAGQICVAPDYAFVPQERVEEFITLFLKRFEKLYLKSNKNPDQQNTIWVPFSCW